MSERALTSDTTLHAGCGILQTTEVAGSFYVASSALIRQHVGILTLAWYCSAVGTQLLPTKFFALLRTCGKFHSLFCLASELRTPDEGFFDVLVRVSRGVLPRLPV